MSSSPPTKATTPPNTSPTASPKAKVFPASSSSASPAISPVALQPPSALMPPSPPQIHQTLAPSGMSAGTNSGISAGLAAGTANSASASAGATLSVPKSTPGSNKPSRQMSNPKDLPGSAYAGIPAGLNLSPGSASGTGTGTGAGAAGMTRLGSRSPSSIPSSPTSIHSSSSAIFERDIEPMGLPSLSLPLSASSSTSKTGHPLRSSTNAQTTSDPHRIPRSKTTEALELTVPSVLDSAVSALAEEPGASITVLSPAVSNVHPLSQSYSAAQSPLSAHSPPSQFGSQLSQPATASATQPIHGQGQGQGQGMQLHGVGSYGSTSGTSAGSPSPPTMSLLLQGMGMSGLVSASASVSGAASASGFASGFASPNASSRAPSPARSASPPVINTIQEHSVPSAPAPGSGSPQAKETLSFTSSSPLKRPSLGVGSSQGLPSPNMKASSRLSFISYTDLLTSAPIASQPLSSVLSPGAHEPPTHLVVVDPEGAPVTTGLTPTTSTGNLLLNGIGSLNVNPADKLDVDSLGTVGLSSTGEWGREGLGGGLEERLERLWQAEREMNERGRVMSTGRGGSRPVSMAFGGSDVPSFTASSPPASAAP